GYPLIIRVTVIVVAILAFITVFGVIRLLFIGYKINKRDKRRRDVEEQFESKLAFVMSNEVNYDIEEIKNLLKYDQKKEKKWKSEILTDLVLSIRDDLNKGEKLNHLNYRNCLENLRLMPYWEKRVKIAGLSKRKEALQIIGSLDVGINTGTLSKSVFHKNSYLRKTARNVYTDQDTYNP